jgi:glycosyltransferase involved in cell wall biosynthesis
MMRVAVIVPSFNEAATVGSVVSDVVHLGYDAIVVDDASADNTAEAAKIDGATVIRLATNLGIGGAVQTGLRYALLLDYDYIVQVDGDGQHDPNAIPLLLAPLIDGTADFVVGSRFMGTPQGYLPPPLRRLGIAWLSILMGRRIRDVTSGFRAMSRQSALMLLSDYPTDYPEPVTLLRALRSGLVVKEVAAAMKPRLHGVSSIVLTRYFSYLTRASLGLLVEYTVSSKRSLEP